MPDERPGDEPVSGYEPTLARESLGERDAEQLEPALGALLDAIREAGSRGPALRRLEALRQLGRLADPRSLEVLLTASRDPDWRLRKAALSALGQLGLAAALPAVEARLGDDRVEVRRAASRALRLLDQGQALSDWATLRADPDWQVRAVALEGLQRYGGAAATTWCLEALADPVWLVRYQALRDLEAVRDPRVLPALLERLAVDKELAPWLATAVARLGPAALDGLLALLAGAPPWRALAVARALGSVDHPKAREALAGLIGHADAEIEGAIAAQGAAMQDAVLARLADPDWVVRWHAVHLSARLAFPGAGVALLPLLEDPRRDVRLAALEALRDVPDPRAEADLLKALGAESWHLRVAAVEALEALATPGAREALVGCLSDARSEVRQAARRALLRLGLAAESELVEALLGNPAVYDEIAWILKEIRRQGAARPSENVS